MSEKQATPLAGVIEVAVFTHKNVDYWLGLYDVLRWFKSDGFYRL